MKQFRFKQLCVTACLQNSWPLAASFETPGGGHLTLCSRMRIARWTILCCVVELLGKHLRIVRGLHAGTVHRESRKTSRKSSPWLSTRRRAASFLAEHSITSSSQEICQESACDCQVQSQIPPKKPFSATPSLLKQRATHACLHGISRGVAVEARSHRL